MDYPTQRRIRCATASGAAWAAMASRESGATELCPPWAGESESDYRLRVVGEGLLTEALVVDERTVIPPADLYLVNLDDLP